MTKNPSEPATEPTETSAPPRRNPALMAAAIALPIALVAGVVVAAALANRNPVLEPVAVGAAETPDAGAADCVALMSALPEEMGDYQKVALLDPAPESVAAWRSTTVADAEPIVLRCGFQRPLEFVQGTSLQEVNNVQWFEIDGSAQGLDASTWVAVDRSAYVALTLPSDTGSAPIQGVSEAIKSAMPAQDIDPAPAPVP
ncbi:DUF3515 domain-containing protein [Tomitella biformata]|uniref:DUF3515 domain-containing protein n=1 Tax=Tomitella biformata TaxID=630403 RepID=UPI000463697B|nr:DUF3515 domain-containing protein [Tomitella biformata]